MRFVFGGALGRAFSIARGGGASNAPRKRMAHSRRKPPRPAASKPRLLINCKTAPSRERSRSLEQLQCPQEPRLRRDRRKRESRAKEKLRTNRRCRRREIQMSSGVG